MDLPHESSERRPASRARGLSVGKYHQVVVSRQGAVRAPITEAPEASGSQQWRVTGERSDGETTDAGTTVTVGTERSFATREPVDETAASEELISRLERAMFEEGERMHEEEDGPANGEGSNEN